MAFGTGFITGLAGSFDKMLQLDMQRNQDRLSRAEQFASTRRLQKLERAEDKGRDLKKNLKELAAITGSHTRAGMAAEGVGGTSDAIAELVKDLKIEQKKLGAGFNVSDFIDFSGENTIKEPRTMVDNFNRFREDIDFSVEVPEGMTKATGLMGKFGMDLKRDVKADVEGMIDVPEEFTAPRDTATLPKGTVSFDKGYQAREFADKFSTDDPKYSSATAMQAHALEIMFNNPEGTDKHDTGVKMYQMANKAIQDAKKDKNSDARDVGLPEGNAIKIVNQVKTTFYDTEFSESIGDSIAAKFSGTNSYKSYFQQQPSVIDEIEKTYNAFEQDKTIGNFLRVEERAYATNSQAYLTKFSRQDIPENKAFTFSKNAQGQTVMTENAAVEPSNENFDVGDISMVKYYEEDADGNNQYVGDTLAVWRGNNWYYLD